jgi:uncharacterized protein (DUF58 family)
MIIPRTRLLLWFALIVVPFATIAGLLPGAVLTAAAVIGALVLVTLLDAALAGRALRGISVELSPLTRVTHERPFRIPVRLGNLSQRARSLRLALALPRGISTTTEEMTVQLPAGSEWSTFDWACAGRARGRWQITTARVEAASPLGFWSRWQTLPVQAEIRVYPNLARERNNLAALFLNRGAFGIHAQRQVGRGRDFEKLREYVAGDSVEDVHWKATAKRGHPVTKVYQIERTQEVYVIIDASRLSARRVPMPGVAEQAGSEVTSLERFISAALVLGLAAEQQGDLFGLLTFSDKIETFLRARNGKSHYHACRDALYTLQAREVAPDYEELSTFIRLRLRRRALLIFLTSLDDPVAAESFVRNMNLLCRQHLVLVNMLQPAGVRPLFSSDQVATVPEMYGELAGHLRWHGLRELEKVLQRRGVKLSMLSGERLVADMVSQYVNVKQRQAL